MPNTVRIASMAWLAGTLLALSFTLAGCAQNAPERAGQDEQIRDFINARYDRLEHSLAQFERYVGLVQEQAEIPEALFHEGRPILQIVSGGAPDLMAEFVAASKGTPLSESDREFFKLTVAAREVQAGVKYDAVFARLKARDASRLVSELNLLSWFIGGLEIRTFLDEIPDELLQECAAQIRSAMLDFDREELWNALVEGEGEPLQRYFEDGPLPTLEYLTSHQIRPVVYSHVEGSLKQIGRSLVASVLAQAFAMRLYDMEYAALRLSGFNGLMGEERAARLHARAMQAVREIEKG